MIVLRNSKTHEEVRVPERVPGMYPAEDGWRVVPQRAKAGRYGPGQAFKDEEDERHAKVRGMGEVGRFDFLVQKIEELAARVDKLESERGSDA